MAAAPGSAAAVDDLVAALAAQGLRTPYREPLSGRFATVGGALSRNRVFHGAALHRTGLFPSGTGAVGVKAAALRLIARPAQPACRARSRRRCAARRPGRRSVPEGALPVRAVARARRGDATEAILGAHDAELSAAGVATREVVARVRAELRDAYDRLGGTHLPIAKNYPFQELLHALARELLAALKLAVDADGRMSPGNLGFGG